MKIKLILLFIASINYNIYSSIWLHVANNTNSTINIYFADKDKVSLKNSVEPKTSKYIDTKWSKIENPYAVFSGVFDAITQSRYFNPVKMDTYAFVIDNDQYKAYYTNEIIKTLKVRQRSESNARTIVRERKSPDLNKEDYVLEISGAPRGAR